MAAIDFYNPYNPPQSTTTENNLDPFGYWYSTALDLGDLPPSPIPSQQAPAPGYESWYDYPIAPPYVAPTGPPEQGGGSAGGGGASGSVGAPGAGTSNQEPTPNPEDPYYRPPITIRPPAGSGGTTEFGGDSWLWPNVYGTATAPDLDQPFYNITTGPNDAPEVISEQDRLAAYNALHALDVGLRDAQNQAEVQSRGSLSDLMTTSAGYGDIYGGQAGFSGQQAEDILQADSVSSALATDAELDQLMPTADEYAGMMGDAWASRDAAAQGLGHQWEVQGETESRLREAFGEDGYYEAPLKNATNRDLLSLAAEYPGDLDAIVKELEGRYGAAIDPNKLGLSDEFNANYNFGPQDIERLAYKAGRDIGFGNASRNQDLEEAAAAHGNTSPAAIAAAKARDRISSEIAKEEAMTDARARGKQISLDVAGNKEGMRLGAESSISDKYIQAAQDVAGKKLANTEGAERMRLDTERDIADRLYQTASETGQARLQSEADIGDRLARLGEFDTSVMTDATRQSEQAQRDRAAEFSSTRRAAEADKLDTRFGQRMDAGNVLSGRYSDIYGQEKKEQAEGRANLSNVWGRLNDDATTTRQQRIQTVGNLLGSAQNASKNAADAWYKRKSTPANWEKIAGAGIGAVGALAGGGGGGG